MFAHECFLILNCSGWLSQEKEGLAAARPSEEHYESCLSLSAIVVSVVSIVTVAVATVCPDLPAGFAAREAYAGGSTLGVNVDIRIAFQNRFHRAGKITGGDALARGSNYVRWSERACNGSGGCGWACWLAVTTAYEDHYAAGNVTRSEMKV